MALLYFLSLGGTPRTMHKRLKQLLTKCVLLIPLLLLWVFLRPIYRDRIGSFGCFDDCSVYMAAYFVNAGKQLYAEIFFNHQPLVVYLSAFIQRISQPENTYVLLSSHRMFIVYFSMVADALLVLRFGLPALAFAFLYESTKGFVFGERFLPESMIVYPIVYLFGLIWFAWKKRVLRGLEVILAAVFSWFIIFSREPYVPLAVLLYGIVLWYSRQKRVWVFGSLVLLGALSLATIVHFDLNAYYFNVVTLNMATIATQEVQANNLFGWGMSRSFFHPIYVLMSGQWNMFRLIEMVLSSLFFILIAMRVRTRRDVVALAVLVMILGLANIRWNWPGEIYYGAFHHIQWYGLFTFTVFLLLQDVWSDRSKRFSTLILSGVAVFFLIWAIASPASYLHDRIDRQTEFATNYSLYYSFGGAVRALSTANDTLFLDGLDDLIYWEAKRYSSYKYVWYTSLMPGIPQYREARLVMFRDSPPTFYYGDCSKGDIDPLVIPFGRIKEYVRLYKSNGPACLFVHTSKFFSISDDQWQAARQYGIIKPI